MRIEQTLYGDFRVYDEMSFSTQNLVNALYLIHRDYKVTAYKWPVTIDLNQKAGFWEAWFVRPVSDEEYVAFVSQFEVESNGTIEP